MKGIWEEILGQEARVENKPDPLDQRVSQVQIAEVKKRIKQVKLSDGRTGYYVTEYPGDGITVYLVYPEDPDYAQVEEEYKRGRHVLDRESPFTKVK